MADFNNIELREALREIKEDRKDDSIRNMAKILTSTSLLIPAIWDKEPKRGAGNQMEFETNTNFQFALATNQKGERYLVLFTSQYDYKHWDTEKLFKPLVLTFDQLQPLVSNVTDVLGVVIDPTDVNVTLSMEFIKQFKRNPGVNPGARQNVNIEKKQFKQGDQITLRPVEGREKLKNAIVEFCLKKEEIKAVYINERINPDNTTHWFLIVDMVPENPEVFQAIGKAAHPYDEGKQMEFLFANYNISKQIMENSKPIYVSEKKENAVS